MDFLKLLRSLEEFLYELCTWFLFFPRTLYRVIVYPRRMAQYVNTELTQKLDKQFDDAISPPMFLMLAVLVAHGVELLMHQQVTGTGQLSRTVFGNEESLLLYRSITFAVWPLISSVHLLRRKKVAMTRESLRRPFFMQCYLTAPFAVALSTSMVFVAPSGRAVHPDRHCGVGAVAALVCRGAGWLAEGGPAAIVAEHGAVDHLGADAGHRDQQPDRLDPAGELSVRQCSVYCTSRHMLDKSCACALQKQGTC